VGQLTERDLTRLSFLMASLVTSPDLWERLIHRVLREEPTSSTYRRVVAELQRLLTRRAASASGLPILRGAAEDLLHQGEEFRGEEFRAAGRLLSAALESAPSVRAAAG
jgi:hypothetical protein